MSFWYPILEPHQIPYYSNINVLLRKIIEQGLSIYVKGLYKAQDQRKVWNCVIWFGAFMHGCLFAFTFYNLELTSPNNVKHAIEYKMVNKTKIKFNTSNFLIILELIIFKSWLLSKWRFSCSLEGHIASLFLESVLRATPNHVPLKIDVHLWLVKALDTSTYKRLKWCSCDTTFPPNFW